MDIATLAKVLARKEASPVEATAAYLARIERLNPRLNAYISFYPEQALETAKQAESEILAGDYRGPLHGVPLAVKDLFQVVGMERTCGAITLNEPPVTEDATSVARLRQGGAVLLGMLNLHEFAFGPTGINPHFGTARNPWNTDLVCGGSSSGSACATAASLAAGALGTDTGGSIRIPASLCGVVGVKQTFGLASRHGIFPLSDDFDHGGPLARTVRDAALLLQAIIGEDAMDPSTRGAARWDSWPGAAEHPAENGLSGLRVGVPDRYFFDDLHPEVETAVRSAIEKFGDLGAEIRPVSLPFAEAAVVAWETIAMADAFTVHKNRMEEQGDRLGPDVLERLSRGKGLTAVQYVEARKTRVETMRMMAKIMEEVELLALPTSPIPAVPIDDGAILVDGKRVEGVRVLGKFTRLASLTGQPAITLPCGFTEGGLPIGLQLMGGWLKDGDMLRAAHIYEQAAGWHERRPPEAT